MAELVFTPDNYKVIFKEEFEPFRPELLELLMIKNDQMEATLKEKTAKFLTMF
jgi:hypothetical protein